MSSQHSHYAEMIEPHPSRDGAPLAGTARIGAELRQVRERAGWKLADIAAAIRIREPYLEAIENGDLEALPGPAYQIGFVRSYAQTLGLDGDEILRRFRAEGVGSVKKPELSFLAPVPDRAVPSGAIVLVGVVLLLVGYGFWFLHTESDRTLAASVPAVPAQLAPLAVPVTPPPAPAPVAKPAITAAPAVAQATAPAQPVPAIIPPASVPPASVPPASVPPASVPPGSAGTASVATPPNAATPALPQTPAPAGKAILATADSWVEVKDATGNILFSRVMHSGDSWPVPDMPGLTLTAGNAGATEISDNGTASQPLGAVGAVVRNYSLTSGGAPGGTPPGASPQAATPAIAAPPLPPGTSQTPPGSSN